MDIESAIIISYGAPGEAQRNALDYLQGCQSDPKMLEIFVSLLFTSNSEQVQFASACFINCFITNSLSEIDSEYMVFLRKKLLDAVFNNNYSDLIQQQINSIVANLAFLEIPDIWVNFFDDLLDFMSESKLGLIKGLNVLTLLTMKLFGKVSVTLMRRTMLIQELSFVLRDILNLINEIDQKNEIDESVAEAFLKFMEYICILEFKNENSDLINNIIEIIFMHFVNFNGAFAVLSNLTMRNTIDKNVFVTTFRLILKMLETDHGNNIDFYIYVCKLISVSMNNFYLNAYDLSFLPSMRSIFEYTLKKAPRDYYIAEVWDMWSKVLESYIEGTEFKTSAIYIIVNPLIPLVYSTFYEILPTSLVLSRLVSSSQASVFIHLKTINEKLLLELLTNKEPSASLCISLGIVNSLFGNEIFDNLLSKLVPIVLEDYEKDLNSVLFFLSRNSKYLVQNQNYFQTFCLLLNNLIFYDNIQVQTSSLLALNHMVNEIAENCKDFVDYLFSKSINFNVLAKDNYLRIHKIASKIVSSINNNEAGKYFLKNIIKPSSNLLLSDSLEMIEIGCEIVNSLCCSKNEEIIILLFSYITQTLEKTKKNEIFSLVSSTFAEMVGNCSWDKCNEIVCKFIDFSLRVPNQDEAFVDAFTLIAASHKKFLEFRQIIFDNFVVKLTNQLTRSFFKFFIVFDILPSEENFVFHAIAEGIKCPDLKISKSAIKLLKKCLQESQKYIDINYEELLKSIFESLFDQLHQKLLLKIISSLYYLLIKMSKKQIQFEGIIFDTIKEKVDDDDFTWEIIVGMKNSLLSKKSFIDILNSFLIATGSSNPIEIQILSDIVRTRSRTIKTFLTIKSHDIGN